MAEKDIHFYGTFYLAIKRGLLFEDAAGLAWTDQMADEMTDADVFGIMTQLDPRHCLSWDNEHIWRTVLVPFHFFPGFDGVDRDGPKVKDGNPWVVYPRSGIDLVKEYFKSRKISLMGLGCHMIQDDRTHQGFTGRREDVNSCFPWYAPRSSVPNIGHGELGVVPDVTNYVWTDPRTGVHINNRDRIVEALHDTWELLGGSNYDFPQTEVFFILSRPSYDERVKLFAERAGYSGLHWGATNKLLSNSQGCMDELVRSAQEHMGNVLRILPAR